MLFVRWCRDTNRCLDTLYREAYQREQTPQWNEIIAAADWQDVAYPAKWNEQAKAGLLTSLHKINYHSLAGIVCDLIQFDEHHVSNG